LTWVHHPSFVGCIYRTGRTSAIWFPWSSESGETTRSGDQRGEKNWNGDHGGHGNIWQKRLERNYTSSVFYLFPPYRIIRQIIWRNETIFFKTLIFKQKEWYFLNF
jgi:hypothetical protein